MLVSFALVFALGALGVFAAMGLRRRDEELTLDNALQRAPHLYAIGGLMLLLGTVALVAYLKPRWLWALPHSVEAAVSLVIWRSVLGVMAFGFAVTATLAFVVEHPRRWALMIASAGVLMPVTALVGERTRPIATKLRAMEHDGVVLQSSGVSCVSASAANLLRLHGRHTTEPEMAELLGATSGGATSAQLLDGLEHVGLSCARVFSRERDLSAVKPPAVLFYGEAYGVPHAVVLEAKEAERVVILDPLGGRKTLAAKEVETWWDGEAVGCGATK